MARPLSCPVCRLNLPVGGTHCPRCGLRIAALERRKPSKADMEAIAAAAIRPRPPITARQALLWGTAAGVVLVALAAVIALAVTRGNAFAAGMSNAAFFTGGIVMTIAVVLGGVRLRRWVGDIEMMRRRALGGGLRAAPDNVRLGVATAAVILLAVALALALVAH
jgi:hypothetical protein